MAPVPLAWYSARMNLTICQCRAVSSSMPADLAICGAMSSVHWARIDEETLVVDGDAVAGAGSGRHRQHLLKDDHR